VEIGISLGLSPREDVSRLIKLLHLAEDLGVSQAWMIDSQLAMKDAYLALAVAARETRSLHLGPGVTNLVTRHETVVANAMATLASFAPGRVVVGVGAGDSAVIPLGSKPLSLARCQTGLRRLQALLAGEAVPGPTGDLRLSFTPIPTPPVYLAASQPGMLELAGRVADGVVIMGPSDIGTVRLQLEHVDRGIRAAGRSVGDVRRDLWVTMAVGELAEATADVKSWASAQARWLTTWRELPSSLETFRDELEDARQHYDFSQHLARRADHAREVSDELARALAVAGPPEECVPRLSALAALGPDRITITLLSGGRERRLHDLVAICASAIADTRV
jgi:5,10-methylenetetrahydromethanopterin reductase